MRRWFWTLFACLGLFLTPGADLRAGELYYMDGIWVWIANPITDVPEYYGWMAPTTPIADEAGPGGWVFGGDGMWFWL